MSSMRARLGCLLVLVAALGAGPRTAAAQEDFYRNKTIRIVVGFSAGGGFDTYSRLLARHIGRHIPGNPTLIVENMTGAGSLVAANYLFKVAKPDGLTIGHFIGGLFLGQILGQKGIEFDTRKFEFIGAVAQERAVCALTKASGISSVEQWMAAPTPVKLGGVAPGASAPDNATRLLRAALGLPIQLVTGYKGTADIRLAAEAGELAGACWSFTSMRVTWRKALEAGEVAVVVQIAPRPYPDLARVPLAINLAKTDEARRLIEIAHVEAVIARPYTLPPRTPKDRVQTLRKAFQATLQDPAFLAEAEKAKLDVEPASGEEFERLIQTLFTLDPSLIPRLKTILLE